MLRRRGRTGGSLRAKRPIRRFWKIMNNGVKTARQKEVGVEMSRGLIDSTDVNMKEKRKSFLKFYVGEKGGREREREGQELKTHHNLTRRVGSVFEHWPTNQEVKV